MQPRFHTIALGLCIIWAVLLTGGLAARVVDTSWLSAIETELKAGSSLVLVALSWAAATFAIRDWRPAATLIAAGMTLGCLGDASPLLGSLWPDPQRTLGNMVLFGLGHVAYIRAFCLIDRAQANQEKRPAIKIWYVSLVLWLVIGTVVWYFAAYLGPHHAVMRIPALAYTLLLSSTAGVAFGYALSNRLFALVAIGAILFLASDVLLAVWIFHDAVYRPFDLVWLTYGVGQMLIVVGSIRNLRALATLAE
ncbi:MAG: lysoplasmalogenase [Planctomycetales bacterium]|nr:lysoplasmalogenase [Planctomycetales bacterium]